MTIVENREGIEEGKTRSEEGFQREPIHRAPHVHKFGRWNAYQGRIWPELPTENHKSVQPAIRGLNKNETTIHKLQHQKERTSDSLYEHQVHNEMCGI
jgi:hypothetical protein